MIRTSTAVPTLALMLFANTSWAQSTTHAESAPSPAAEAGAKPAPEPGDPSLAMGNTLAGPTGLTRVISADSGAPGTLRVSLAGSFFSGNGFLCPTCAKPNGALISGRDQVGYSAQGLQLSATITRFLEAHAALRNQQTSNDRSDPKVIQTSGDLSIGAKAFIPTAPNQVVHFGGGAFLGFLSEASGVGVATANVRLHAESTLDLTEMEKHRGLPLRIHFNGGYLFDNSGTIADSIEATRTGALGARQRITRMERFGHGINRIDSVNLGLGIEGVFSYIRPFAEWTLDIPANRQGYTCALRARTAGDLCYSRSGGFSSMPSRFTVGVRGYPWVASWAKGISLLAAADIGTGATSTFIEEVAPELPWSVHLALGYAFDTRPQVKRVVEEKQVQVPLVAPAAPEFHIEGTVMDSVTHAPIEGAAVFFKDGQQQALLTGANGSFWTASLQPGEYPIHVTKDGYRDGECSGSVGDSKVLESTPPPVSESGAVEEATPSAGAAVPADSPPTPVPTPAPLPTPGSEATVPTRAPGTSPAGPQVTQVRCELTALPTVARVDGTLRDAETTEFVSGATVRLSDARDRSLKLQTDGQGGFRFENVLAGSARILVEAEGYLPTAAELRLKARDALLLQLSAHKRPRLPNVVVTKTELQLKKQVHFLFDSTEILPDSMALVEEIAEALQSRPELTSIEIQGHTDNVGDPAHNQELSGKRAGAVREALILLGIEPSRLTFRGFGQQKPLVPNVSPANRAKNRRVQLMIQR